MSGETEQNVSAWTVDSLHSHILRLLNSEITRVDQIVTLERLRIDQRFLASEKAVNAALKSSEKAILKSERTSEARFASVNEFRQTLTDQASTFISKVEAEARLSALDARMTAIADNGIAARAAIVLRVSELQARLDGIQGISTGEAAANAARYRQQAQLIAIGGFLLGIVTLTISIYIGSR